MPNWPRNSCRAKPRSSRLELRPMVASSSCTWVSVRPMPVSWTRRLPSPVASDDSKRIDAGASGRRRLGGGDRIDRVLQQFPHEDPWTAVEVVAQQVDDTAEVDLERFRVSHGPLTVVAGGPARLPRFHRYCATCLEAHTAIHYYARASFL